MLRRSFSILLCGAALALLPAGAILGQDDEGRIDVIEITGGLDPAAIAFVERRVMTAAELGSIAAIIQIDSSVTLSNDIEDLVELVAAPPLPVVVWVGPDPAVAYGGAVVLLEAATVGSAAPGVEIGFVSPVVAGGGIDDPEATDILGPLRSAAITVDGLIEGLVDIVAPSISNLLVELNGRQVDLDGQVVTLETVRDTEDGTAAVRTVFSEPGLWTRTLRTAVTVEAAFFFLVIGLTVAAFEFYAIGPGIAAGVAVACLLVAGYGLAVLPLRWWAVALTVVSLWLLTVDFQRGGAGPLTIYGTVLLFVGGRFFTDAQPQIVPSWWIVAIIVLSTSAFYVVAMSTVARSRFSTPTIGREHLIGRQGVAISDFAPNGQVEVDGARWQAAAHREAGLGVGDPVEVVGVDGLYLEVEPIER